MFTRVQRNPLLPEVYQLCFDSSKFYAGMDTLKVILLNLNFILKIIRTKGLSRHEKGGATAVHRKARDKIEFDVLALHS